MVPTPLLLKHWGVWFVRCGTCRLIVTGNGHKKHTMNWIRSMGWTLLTPTKRRDLLVRCDLCAADDRARAALAGEGA